MKNLTALFLILSIQITLKAQENPNPWANIELGIINETGNELTVKVYPVSAIFNGYNIYNFVAKSRSTQGVHRYDYIAGVGYVNQLAYKEVIIQPISNSLPGWDDDKFGVNGSAFGLVSFGIYKIVIKNNTTNHIDSVLVEFDYYDNTSETSGDFYIYIYPDNNPDPRGRFFYTFERSEGVDNNYIEIHYLTPRGYTAYAWEPNPGISLNKRDKRFGPPNSMGLEYKIETDPIYNLYSILPLDSRRDCYLTLVNSIDQNHMFPGFYNYITYNTDQYEERHGYFSLDIIIKKNIRTPAERWYWSSNNNAPPTDVVILPGVTFTIDKGNPGNNTTYTEYFLTKYTDNVDNTGTNFIVQGPNSEFSGATLKLNHSEVYETNARMRFGEKCKLTLEQGSNTIIEKYGNLIFENGGEMFMHENSNITFYDHGEIIINSGGKVFNCGANITNNSNVCILINNGGQYHIGSEFCNNNVEHLFDNGSFLAVKNGGELRVADNSNIIFDGLNSFLKAEQGAIIKMGANSSIEFRNGAYLDAEGITFEGNNGATWEGLVFHNAGGQTKIENCTLKNAKISVDIINTTGCYANLEKKFINNVFDQISSSTHIIKAENVFKVLMQGNIFNIADQKIGVEIKNTINAGMPSFGAGQGLPCNTSYALNLLNNTFNNGGMQLYLNCWAAAVTPFMVQGNGFYNSSGLTSISIAGRKVSGDFKQNNFSSSSNSINTNVILLQSSVNMFNNQLQSTQLENLWSNLQSSFKMAPIYQNGQWIWYGGFNNLSSQRDNILVTNGSTLPTLDFGKNCFAIPMSQGQDKYHITGSGIQWNVAQHQTYYIRENSWNGWMGNNIPVINITNHQNQHIPYLHTPTISCPSTAWDGYTTHDLGFGIYDTVYYNNVGDLPEFEEDHELFNQAIYGYYDGDYLTSINSFKTLILGHPESSYTEACLYDMYDSYRALDTSSEQSYTDNLYSDLKNFLSAIILDESHSEDFNFTAFEIIQMCEVNMQKYNDALTGYEFIAMYHPDPEARFLASADHQEIMDMLGEGQGGMILSAEEKLNRLEKKLSSFVKNDPVSQKLSKQYESQLNEKVIKKSSRDSKELNSNEVSRMSRFEKEEKAYNFTQKEIINKANTLLLSGRSMTKEERRDIVTEGILLIARLTSGDVNTEIGTTPSNYSLTQNYPNPFNPLTNISFSIPVVGLVKLKVFDITGREVAVLVNELKTPGSYNVSFNGSRLSSGVYFYRIEAGSFVETKRMLMIK